MKLLQTLFQTDLFYMKLLISKEFSNQVYSFIKELSVSKINLFNVFLKKILFKHYFHKYHHT